MNIQLIRYYDIGNINTRLAKSLNERQGVLPPLGIAYLASSLEKAGHKVNIIDAPAELLTNEQVRSRIRDFHPNIVGVTSMTPSFLGTLEAARIAKEEGAITVVGGVHMDIFAEETLSYDCIDYGLVGEAEESFVKLCEFVSGTKKIEDIEGIAYKHNDRIIVKEHQIIDNLDSLRFPAYHLLPMDKYNSIIGLRPVSTMISSRGCPYRCSFCYKSPSDKKHRTRSAKNIVDEMELLVNNYKVKEIMFYDDLMFPEHVENLCREISKRKLKVFWETPQRVDLVNKDLLGIMKQAGCRMLRFGVEQGDPEMMRFVEKKITIDKVKQVFGWARSSGIDSFAYFIIGCIHENEKTIKASIKLAKKLNPRFVMFTKATPLPNTPLFEIAVKEGFITRDYWRNFVLGAKNDPIKPFVKDAQKWVSKAYREFYLRPSKIIEQLMHINNVDSFKKGLDGFLGILALDREN